MGAALLEQALLAPRNPHIHGRRNAEDDIGVGAEGLPEIDGARCRHALDIRAPIQQIEDELQMEMGDPIAVMGRRADPADVLAGDDFLAGLQKIQRLQAEMAIEGVEAIALVRPMLEDHDRAIVALPGIVMHGMDHRIERAEDRLVGGQEDIQPKMDIPPLPARRLEQGAAIDRPRLPIAPDAGNRPGFRQPRRHAGRARLHIRQGLQLREIGAALGPIEDQHRRLGQIMAADRADGIGLGREIIGNACARRMGRQAAGGAERVMHETRRYLRQPRQQGPGIPLADEEILVLRLAGRLPGRHADALRQPRAGEIQQQRELQLRQPVLLVIAADDAGHGGHRIRLGHHAIRAGDGDFDDPRPHGHVAEIDEPGAGAVRIHHDVPFIRVVMDDLMRQSRQCGNDIPFIGIQHPGRDGALGRIGDMRQQGAMLEGRGHGPEQLARLGGMAEIAERAVEAAEESPQRAQQRRAIGAELAHERARQPIQQPHEARRTVGGGDGGDRRPLAISDGPRHRHAGVAGQHMAQRCVLKIEDIALGTGPVDLQDIEAIAHRHQEVLVELPRQLLRRTGETIETAQDRRGIGGRESAAGRRGRKAHAADTRLRPRPSGPARRARPAAPRWCGCDNSP